MVCDNCSETDECRCGAGEMCGVCFESRVKPEDVPRILALVSERSSSEPRCRRCGNPIEWLDYTGDPGWCHSRGAKNPCSGPAPALRCTCGHEMLAHERGRAALCYGFGCECQDFTCDHSTCGWKPREEPEEPPLTPEEEEEAAGDECCGECKKGEGHPWCGPCSRCEPAEPPPPQPERRPPYAVAYSVQGHLYEVALSGDATVRAVDGALVIQHHLGPVAGIVSVLPVINKES